MKRLNLTEEQADKLTVRLSIDDVLFFINTVLAKRKAKIHLIYNKDIATVYLSAHNTSPEPILSLCIGSKRTNRFAPVDPTLSGLLFTLVDGLRKLDTRFELVIQKSKAGAKYAKLQLFFKDSRLITVTLLETKRNTSNSDGEFNL